MRTSTRALLCLLLASLTPLNAQQPVVGDDGRSDVESKIISLEKRLWNGDTNDAYVYAQSSCERTLRPLARISFSAVCQSYQPGCNLFFSLTYSSPK